MPSSTTTLDAVQHYYGSVLATSSDLKTSACCSTETLPNHVREILSELDDEILNRFYGCGSPIPLALEGATVLDLGCGSGRDVFVASKLVGPQGRAIGVDMTSGQLDVANRHREGQARRFGYARPNTEFRSGYIEDLRSAGIENESIDVVISNCVINLSPDKPAVLSEIFRVLRPGGELYFSDVFADRRVPSEIAGDPVLYGECLGGAMYTEDFRRMMYGLGCPDFRVISETEVEINDPDLAERMAGIAFTSRTIRAFKLGDLMEDQCEDYGQVATYLGGIPHAERLFELDPEHRFEKGRPERVCGNSAAMVQDTRFGRYFDVAGSRDVHFGLFDCGSTSPSRANPNASANGSCC